MTVKAAIFDLDGTILNTMTDLADAVNYGLEKNGFPKRELSEFNMLIGNGQRYMCEHAIPEGCRDIESVQKVVDDFNIYYKDHSNDKTAVYDGILDLINYLRSKGVYVGVFTNKPHVHAVRMVKDYFGDLFDTTIGNMPGRPVKPDPCGVIDIMEASGAKEGECIYFGDSGVDMETAVNAKAAAIGVLWGFRSKEELEEHGAQYLLEKPQDFYSLGLI